MAEGANDAVISKEVSDVFTDEKYASILPGLCKYIAPNGGTIYLDDIANTTGPESHILPDGREIDVAGPTKPLMRDFVDAEASSKYLCIAESAMAYVGTLGDVANGFAKHAISCRVRAMIEIAHQQVLAQGHQSAGASRRGGEKEARDMERKLHNSLERMQRHIRGESASSTGLVSTKRARTSSIVS